ncbi:ubiquitin carboxyl-terminal hydrolase 23 [Neltuma alba]|uniref:ubiquitin carboxyl-terminal hydrolase 23 n=1 Tax=Neltuma alba TaxID=207710 RepID=UPI0010A370EF|nr:ubiquitin carboxyl-terminal hydrolase 23 [Prosopis alba]
MVESLLAGTETKNPLDSGSDHSNGSVLFSRRIEFLPAKKPFKGFSDGGSDFKLETLNPVSSSEARRPGSGSVGKKHDGSEFFDFGLDPELSFGITVRRIGAGLRNLGNTCFLNSVLQCLTYTEPLAAYLQSGKHKSSCHVAGFCALCAIQNHVSRALQSTGRILSPEDLVMNLRCISRNFRNARQEDAHEYMVNLLESMHKCCLPSGVPSESPGAYERSLVHKIFGGRLRSQVKCHQCLNCSNKFDPFLDLSLEIFKADSLQKALSNFTAAEWLDGGERQYQCQRCKQKVKALKQLTIHKAPYVLTIHLKRFYAHDPGQKIKKRVQFGCALDLKPFVSGSYDGDLTYSLYGVLVHSGSSTHSGHYYCYVRTANNMWYTLDDNRVSHVSEREVLNQQAYMLFYVRDRKSSVSKKPVDIAQKENIEVNVSASKATVYSSQALKKELVLTGQTENLLSKTCSSAEAPKSSLNIDSLRGSLSKDASNQQRNSPLKNRLIQNKQSVSEPCSQPPAQKDCLIQNKQSVSESCSQPPAQKESLELPPLAKSEPESLLPLGECVNNSCTHNMKNLVASATDFINKGKENGVSKEDVKDTLSLAPSVSDPEKAASQPVIDETSQKINGVTTLGGSSANTSKSTASTISLIQPSNSSCQVGGSATGSEGCDKSGNQVCEKVVGNQPLVLDKSGRRSMDIGGLSHKRIKKSRKKLLKYRVSSLHVGSNFLVMASFSLRKKKKNKKIERQTSDIKNLNKEKLDEYISSDVGPSSSVGSVGTKSSYKHATNHLSMNSVGGESVMENIANGEFRKRIDQDCAVLATAKHVEKVSGHSSVANHCDSRQPNRLRDGNREQMHSSSMSKLARGLEVPRWDDVELPSSQSKESKSEIMSIGYVGDEWDEEYDMGKRKKLRRFKHSFGGPNPFQEIATEKSRFKRAKLEQCRSGNLPFRSGFVVDISKLSS